MSELLTTAFIVLALLFTAEHSSLVEAGDVEFTDINYPAAMELYRSALEIRPEDPDIHWRLARVFVPAGEVAPKSERVELYRKAEQFARRCIELDPYKAEGHTWLATALGNRALLAGGKTKIQLANEIKKELDRAIALRNDDDVTYSILGSYYFTVGSVNWLERQIASIFLDWEGHGNIYNEQYRDSILFVSIRAIGTVYAPTLHLMYKDGSGIHALLHRGNAYMAAWSPKKWKVLFTMGRISRDNGLYVINADRSFKANGT